MATLAHEPNKSIWATSTSCRCPAPDPDAAGYSAIYLGALDDKIDLNRRMNETLDAMTRAIFKDWFVDFGPTRAKMEGRAPYLAPEVWALFPDRLDNEGKPEGWTTNRLDQLQSSLNGSLCKSILPSMRGVVSACHQNRRTPRRQTSTASDKASVADRDMRMLTTAILLFSWSESALRR